MAEFGKEVKVVDDLGIIYLENGISIKKWIKSKEWIPVLYGYVLYAAKQIVYEGNTNVPMATVVSIEYQELGEMELPVIHNQILYLTIKNLEARLNEILQYAEEREKYEDCAKIRDMLIAFKNKPKKKGK